jgi:hypothetical protein
MPRRPTYGGASLVAAGAQRLPVSSDEIHLNSTTPHSQLRISFHLISFRMRIPGDWGVLPHRNSGVPHVTSHCSYSYVWNWSANPDDLIAKGDGLIWGA